MCVERDCMTHMKYRPKATKSWQPILMPISKLSGPNPPAESSGVDPKAFLNGFKLGISIDSSPNIVSFSLALLNSSNRGSIRCLNGC
jgi:hypothetical protein